MHAVRNTIDIVRRRVTNDRTTAPCGVSHCPRVTCPLELIALIVDLGRSILVNNGFRLFVCLGYRTVVVADNNAMRILQQRPFAARDILHIKHTKIFDLRLLRARQCKQGGIPRHVFEIKIDLCKILNVVCRCSCIDIERIPCCLILCVVTTSAAENLAGRNISDCPSLRIAEVDRIARGITMLRKATVDKTAYSPPIDRDHVARRHPHSRRSIASVEFTRRTARDGYLVALAVIALRDSCRCTTALGIAAVNLSVPRRSRNCDLIIRRSVTDGRKSAVHINFRKEGGAVARIDRFSRTCKLIVLVVKLLIPSGANLPTRCNITLVCIGQCEVCDPSTIIANINPLQIGHQCQSFIRCSCKMNTVPVNACTLI